MSTILAATTSAANSESVTLDAQDVVTIMVSPDLAGSETADIQITPDGGATWVDYQYDGAAIELTASQNAIRLYGPMKFRVAKDATAGATGVFLNRA